MTTDNLRPNQYEISGELSAESLAVLDGLEETCPELWQYIRESAQTNLIYSVLSSPQQIRKENL